MKYNPHDYQTFATNFVLEHPYCGLILDMGLGKSVITLTALWDLLLDSFDACRVLVVAPKRVAEDTWPREIQKWEHLHGLTFSLVLGSEKERRAALSRQAMIYIINRENVSWLVENHRWDFDQNHSFHQAHGVSAHRQHLSGAVLRGCHQAWPECIGVHL